MYAVAASCYKIAASHPGAPLEISHFVHVFLEKAPTSEDAVKSVRQTMLQKYPVKSGWSGHKVAIVEVPEESA